MENIDNNSSKNEPLEATKARRKSSGIGTVPKIGLSNKIIDATKRALMFKAMERRRQLTIPGEILSSHPDKHFVWVNYNKLQASGMWHGQGYELLKAKEELPGDLAIKFGRSPDGYIHRNEMVLAYLTKEEHEERQLEREILKGSKDVTELITRRPELAAFNPTAEAQKEFVQNHKEE